jgi:hypothetical protein
MPPFCIASLLREQTEAKKQVYVLVTKLKSEESTFASLARAQRELNVERGQFVQTSWYQTGFSKGGSVLHYEVVTLNTFKDGSLELSPGETTRGAGGTSVQTAEGLIKSLLGIDVQEARRKYAAEVKPTKEEAEDEDVEDDEVAETPSAAKKKKVTAA